MKRLWPQGACRVARLFPLGMALLAVPIRGQVSEKPEQQNTRVTKDVSKEESELLLRGIKRIYGIGPDFSKLTVGEGRKTESILESLVLSSRTGSATGSFCSASSRGDVVSGVIIAEDKNMVYIDAKPCDLKLFSVRKPYSKTKVGTVTCKGKVLDRYAVTQH